MSFRDPILEELYAYRQRRLDECNGDVLELLRRQSQCALPPGANLVTPEAVRARIRPSTIGDDADAGLKAPVASLEASPERNSKADSLMSQHPFQDQVNRMWGLIKKSQLALKGGFWLEAICLAYTLLEIELRLLLASKAGANAQPVNVAEIKQEQHLRDLATMALSKGFIDSGTYGEILNFNRTRNAAIHGLAEGRIDYDDLQAQAVAWCEIAYRIQSRWLSITWGPEETLA